MATTRPDGRPHVVLLGAVKVDDVRDLGGSPETVDQRNLTANAGVVIHLCEQRGWVGAVGDTA